MSEIEPTKPGSYEPTQPASYNPYDIYPYSDVPELPPPPPKKRTFIRYCVGVLIIIIAVLASWRATLYLYQQSQKNIAPIVVPHVVPAIPEPTATAKPTPTPAPIKSALTILSDLENAGLAPTNTSYGVPAC